MSEMGKNYEKATETRARVCGISILSAPDSKNKDDFSASLPTLFADPTTNAAASKAVPTAGPPKQPSR